MKKSVSKCFQKKIIQILSSQGFSKNLNNFSVSLELQNKFLNIVFGWQTFRRNHVCIISMYEALKSFQPNKVEVV